MILKLILIIYSGLETTTRKHKVSTGSNRQTVTAWDREANRIFEAEADVPTGNYAEVPAVRVYVN